MRRETECRDPNMFSPHERGGDGVVRTVKDIAAKLALSVLSRSSQYCGESHKIHVSQMLVVGTAPTSALQIMFLGLN